MTKQKKLRITRPAQENRNYKEVYGIDIPHDIAIFYKDCYFTPEKTELGILLISGTKFNLQIKDIEPVDLEIFKE